MKLLDLDGLYHSMRSVGGYSDPWRKVSPWAQIAMALGDKNQNAKFGLRSRRAGYGSDYTDAFRSRYDDTLRYEDAQDASFELYDGDYVDGADEDALFVDRIYGRDDYDFGHDGYDF